MKFYIKSQAHLYQKTVVVLGDKKLAVFIPVSEKPLAKSFILRSEAERVCKTLDQICEVVSEKELPTTRYYIFYDEANERRCIREGIGRLGDSEGFLRRKDAVKTLQRMLRGRIARCRQHISVLEGKIGRYKRGIEDYEKEIRNLDRKEDLE